MGLLAGTYIALLLLTSLPAFQSWGAGVASRMLSEKLESRVSVKRLKLNMLGRIVLDNVQLYDRRDTLMLQASRIAAKVDLMPLLERKIRISGAQLIGTQARLYRDGDEPFNFQFVVDAFSSKDTTSTPLDLAVGALVVRRGDVRLDLLREPTTDGRFNPHHLHFTDLSLTARVHFIKPDSLALNLRHLSFQEQSGLKVKRFEGEAKVGRSGTSIQDLLLELPTTSLRGSVRTSAPLLALPLREEGLQDRLDGNAELTGIVCPRDLACFLPRLATFSDALQLSARATLHDGSLRLPDLTLSDSGDNLSLLLDATVSDVFQVPTLFCDIREMRTGPSVGLFLTRNLQGEPSELSPVLTRLGSTRSTGTVSCAGRDISVGLRTESEQGTVAIEGTLLGMQELQAKLNAESLRLAGLLGLQGEEKNTVLSAEMDIEGRLPTKGEQAHLLTKGVVKSLLFRGYEHLGMRLEATLDGEDIAAELHTDEPAGSAHLNLLTTKHQQARALTVKGELQDFSPHVMNLTRKYEGERFSGSVDATFQDLNPDKLQGSISLSDVQLASDHEGTLRLGNIELTSDQTERGSHLALRSNFLSAVADGNFNWKSLSASISEPLRQCLPSLFSPRTAQQQAEGNDFRFLVELQDTAIASRLLGTNLRLPQRSTLEGTVSDATRQASLLVHIPQLEVAGQVLQNIDCRAEAGTTSLQASLQGERLQKGQPVELFLDAYAKDDKVTSRLRWDDKGKIRTAGDISMTGTFRRDLAARTAVDAKLNRSDITVGDSVWHVEPASIRYHDNVLDVEGLSIRQGERHITLGGRVSDTEADTLRAELADIDISYIMDLIGFHKVDFDGRATGTVYASSLMKKPLADAYLQVGEFTFNSADLGDMDLYAGWGKQEGAITLEADMRGPVPEHHTHLTGSIIPAGGMDDGLDLRIRTDHIDLSFLRKYTGGIFSGLEGRASGWTRVFGPFKYVNLEGDMFVNEMKMHVLATGTDYHLAGDSVILRPDNIWLRGAHVYDYLGGPGMSEHTATVDAHLMHDALKHLRFDVSVDAHNMLGYNFPHQGAMNFFGTAYADAQVHMSGTPGSVLIDISATPMPGTMLCYNTATTSAVAETDFITYTKKSLSPTFSQGEGVPSPLGEVRKGLEESLADMHINFDINANPNAQIRILLDPTTGDNISLYGNGRLRASYYNKGRFQLFGTYRTSEGNYRMSIRDVIRKDFTFQPDGTIVFGGDAMKAALNLRAIHTVPNVSLDDLSATGLGLSNTRVDCIMNIGGNAGEPVISFDFDIPSANEDEKQMVRSMLSSEEERDMQAIYLLGIGRFYSYGTVLDRGQGQGGMAMNSVLSSALSSRFNQIMSSALGGTGWSLGTNLRTGEEGWQELDAEALVSGKMLSGRLQFNGNFGYRENKYKMGSNNFIGDFDIQYRLSPRSPFSLKAYNQTNDRYFTQSSLTTQGIGIKFQRDFNNWLELFRRTGREK